MGFIILKKSITCLILAKICKYIENNMKNLFNTLRFHKFVIYLNSVHFSDEFDIIASVKPENKSCPFVLDETKLGIFSWCVKDLFRYVYAELIARKCKCLAAEKEGGVSSFGEYHL
jgi:hypothetical protein